MMMRVVSSKRHMCGADRSQGFADITWQHIVQATITVCANLLVSERRAFEALCLRRTHLYVVERLAAVRARELTSQQRLPAHMCSVLLLCLTGCLTGLLPRLLRGSWLFFPPEVL